MDDNITLDVEDNPEKKSIYPDAELLEALKVYLNGHLIKTAYSINTDPQAKLKTIKLSEKQTVESIEISVVVEKDGWKKIIEVDGLMSRIWVSAWERIEK